MAGSRVGVYQDDRGRNLDQAKRIKSSSARAVVAAGATGTLVAAPAAGQVIRVLSASIAETTAVPAAGEAEFRDGAAGTPLFVLGTAVSGYAQRNFAGKVSLTAATLLQVKATGADYDVHVEYVVEGVND